jgi:IS4 transposase
VGPGEPLSPEPEHLAAEGSGVILTLGMSFTWPYDTSTGSGGEDARARKIPRTLKTRWITIEDGASIACFEV